MKNEEQLVSSEEQLLRCEEQLEKIEEQLVRQLVRSVDCEEEKYLWISLEFQSVFLQACLLYIVHCIIDVVEGSVKSM